MSDIQVTSVDGSQINVTAGALAGPLPELQLTAGKGISIANAGGVSTISANFAELSIASNLSDLSDISGTPTAGQVLAYNGTAWSGLTLSVPSNLSDLSDISGTPTTGQVLTYNGTVWGPANSSGSANVSAGVETINSLTGNLTIQSGAGIVVDATGDGLITIGRPTVPQHGVAAWQSLDGNVTLMWSAIPDPAESDYAIQVLEVDNQSVPTGNISMVAEPKITVNVQADVAAQELSLVFLPNGTTLDESSSAFADGLLTSGRNAAGWSPESISLTVEGLPDTITAPGDFDVYGKTVDPAGYETAWTLIGTAAATSHGKPSPPTFLAFVVSQEDGEASIAIDPGSTIHMRGFVAESTLSYQVQATTTPSDDSSWANIATIASGETTATAQGLSIGQTYSARVRTIGPFGAGEWAVREADL